MSSLHELFCLLVLVLDLFQTNRERGVMEQNRYEVVHMSDVPSTTYGRKNEAKRVPEHDDGVSIIGRHGRGKQGMREIYRRTYTAYRPRRTIGPVQTTDMNDESDRRLKCIKCPDSRRPDVCYEKAWYGHVRGYVFRNTPIRIVCNIEYRTGNPSVLSQRLLVPHYTRDEN